MISSTKRLFRLIGKMVSTFDGLQNQKLINREKPLNTNDKKRKFNLFKIRLFMILILNEFNLIFLNFKQEKSKL